MTCSEGLKGGFEPWASAVSSLCTRGAAENKSKVLQAQWSSVFCILRKFLLKKKK